MAWMDRFRRGPKTSAPARNAARTGSTRVRAADSLDLDHLFTWVAERDATYHLGTTEDAVEAAYYAAKDDLASTPRGQLGPAE